MRFADGTCHGYGRNQSKFKDRYTTSSYAMHTDPHQQFLLDNGLAASNVKDYQVNVNVGSFPTITITYILPNFRAPLKP